jgi:hypothetical protein
MSETLLRDLAQYKNAREKGARLLVGHRVGVGIDKGSCGDVGVAIAARGLISLFRDVDPTLLHKKDRGRTAQENLREFTAPRYGATHTVDHVPGAEVHAART